jgi:hypothetical protein
MMTSGDERRPRPPSRSWWRGLLRWLNAGKRRYRPAPFGREFWINVAAIVSTGFLCTAVIKASDRPPRPAVVGNPVPRPTTGDADHLRPHRDHRH